MAIMWSPQYSLKFYLLHTTHIIMVYAIPEEGGHDLSATKIYKFNCILSLTKVS